jgi:ketosteroid isomerase-like protein
MTEPDQATQALLEALYERFNARDLDAILRSLAPNVEWPNGWEGGYVRGHDAVRDYWTRQWRAIDSTVTPKGFVTRPDGRVDVTVHQVVKSLAGELLDEATVHHIYQVRAGQIEHMEIARQARSPEAD